VGGLDWIAIAAYAVAVLAVGRLAARSAGATPDHLLAGRSLPTGLVLLSMVATELSAATFIGVPHAAYTGDWSYLQLAFGALAAKLVLAARVIPAYHRAGVVTVYGYLRERFGASTHRAAAACFVAGRTLASGARLFIAALAFAAAAGVDIGLAITGCALAAGIYTRWGGLRAVVWTDALQAAVFVAAALVALAMLTASAEGGLGEILGWARESGRSRIFHTEPWIALASGTPLASAVLAGFFLTLATHSTDHDMVQRLLAARDGVRGGRALWISAAINFPMTALFLGIGTALAFHHLGGAAGYDVSDARQVFPLFALHELPPGLRGLVFAGLFAAGMSSLDSAICAIAASWISDLAPHEPGPDGDTTARMRRLSVWTCIALAAAALAMAAYQEALEARGSALPSLVEFALSAMSVLYGGLLGVFAVGFLWPSRGDDRSAVLGLAVGSGVGLGLFLQPLLGGDSWIAWGYRIPLAALITALVVTARARRGAG
jgi:SSS family transporter